MVDEQPNVELEHRRAARPAASRSRHGSPPWRSRPRRSRRTCRARERWRARRPSASARRARPARRERARTARTPRTRAGSPRSPTPDPPPESPSPAQQVIERPALRPHRPIREHPARALLDRRDCVRGLVRVRPDHDHLHRPFSRGSNGRISGRHISVGAMPRSYQVRPAIHGRRRATQRAQVKPTVDSKGASQLAADPNSNELVGQHHPATRL